MTRLHPKVLYLVHRVPFPPNRGDRIRSYHLLKAISQCAEVHLAFLADERPDRETLAALEKRCARVAAVPLGPSSRWLSAVQSLVLGRTATEGLFRSRRLRKTLRCWADEVRYDAAVVFCSSMVQYLDVPGLANVPVMVDLVDVDSQKWFDYAELAAGWKRRLFRLEGRRLRRLEAGVSRRAAAVTLVSEDEANLYRGFCPSDRVFAVPNGVDLDYFRPDVENARVRSQRCVFVGALDYRANVDGVTWFCREVWPLIRQRFPQATFHLVGSRPGPAIDRLAGSEGVHVVGEVADVRPHLAACSLVIVPLRVARGIQNKVLEALAMGKPVLATPQAVTGLCVEPGVELEIAALPAEWGDKVSALFESPDRRDRMARAGRQCVERHYDWSRREKDFLRLSGLDVFPPRSMEGSARDRSVPAAADSSSMSTRSP